MPDVTIPADDAKAWADSLRRVVATGHNCPAHLDALADLLDPRPLSLREQVDATLAEQYRYWHGRMFPDGEDHRAARDAVLAVIADRLAAEQDKDADSWGMTVTPDFYAGLAVAESILRGES